MPGFEPGNPAYAERVQSSFNYQQVMTLLGAKLTRPAPGECEIQLAFEPESTRPHGCFHGGIVGTIADSAVANTGIPRMQALMTMHGSIDP
jgi:acyl-coenzyme A thioesterase PaaI-like protein